MAIFSYKVGDAARVLTTKLKKKRAFFFAPSGTMHMVTMNTVFILLIAQHGVPQILTRRKAIAAAYVYEGPPK